MPQLPISDPTGIDRRGLLRRLWQATGGALSLALLGCAAEESAPEAESTVRIPLASLDAEGRAVVKRPALRVEFRKQGEEYVARSLLCTHFGCFVEWNPTQGRYLCPCHDGVFDSDGQALFGPPQRPLQELPVRLEGETLVADVSGLSAPATTSSR